MDGPREAGQLLVHGPHVDDGRAVVNVSERAPDRGDNLVERRGVANVERRLFRRGRRIVRRDEHHIFNAIAPIAAVEPVRYHADDDERLPVRGEPERGADCGLSGPHRGREPFVDNGSTGAAARLRFEVAAGNEPDAERAKVAGTHLVLLGNERLTVGGDEALGRPEALDRPSPVRHRGHPVHQPQTVAHALEQHRIRLGCGRGCLGVDGDKQKIVAIEPKLRLRQNRERPVRQACRRQQQHGKRDLHDHEAV